MRSIDFYEFTGLVVPGAVLLAAIGILLDVRDANHFLNPDGLGNAVVYLVFAYVIGHLIAGVGIFVERFVWKLWKGMPTDWPITRPAWSAGALWKQAVEKHCGEACDEGAISKWRALVSRARSTVYSSGRSSRLNVFNGNYGMFRGLAVAQIIIAALAWKTDYNITVVYAVLIAAFILTLYRMHHFGVLYAKELFANVAELGAGSAQRQ